MSSPVPVVDLDRVVEALGDQLRGEDVVSGVRGEESSLSMSAQCPPSRIVRLVSVRACRE